MVSLEIAEYVERNIIPRYLAFDKAHSSEHIGKVIQNSISISSAYQVDMNMVYVIAAYHDIGLSQGRDNHEKTSAAFLLADAKLREWFSGDELLLMAEAVEDHRASNDYEPRSIYGKIISEADRDIEYLTILRRTIQYGLKNNPEYDYERHFKRTFEHIRSKYGDGGYLKLWLNTDMNQRNLKKVRYMITQPDKFRADFDEIFSECTE